MCQRSFPSFPINGTLLFISFHCAYKEDISGLEVAERIPSGSFPPRECVYFLLFSSCLRQWRRREDGETKTKKGGKRVEGGKEKPWGVLGVLDWLRSGEE